MASLSLGAVSRLSLWIVMAAVAGTACARLDRPGDLASSLPVHKGISIIVVSFDALRADALGVYGYPRKTSPNLDEFARRALVIERAYTTAPVTPTSFASMFTGRMPWKVFRSWKLADATTMAETFGRAGYTTGALVNNEQLGHERHFNRGFRTFHVFETVDDRRVLDRAVRWLDEHRGQHVLVWIHFLTPHAPYDRQADAGHLYDPSYTGRFTTTSGETFRAESPAELARIRSLYDGEVFQADALFGRLRAHLEETGWLSRSLLVVTSDHGEQFNEHGNVQHATLHEEAIRIPLLVFHPDVKRGARTTIPYSHADLLPTLTAIAGVEHRGPIDGRNLLAETNQERSILAIAMTDQPYLGASLRQGGTKLIVKTSPHHEIELFDLDGDPGEKRNLASVRADVARRLSDQLENELGSDGLAAIRANVGLDPTEGLDPARRDRLRSLGYVGGR